MLCYRVKGWSFLEEGERLVVQVSCTTHPSNTSLPAVIERSFEGASVSLANAGGLSIGGDVIFLGTDGEMILTGAKPPLEDLEALFTLLTKVVSIRDDAEITVCVDVYRTPIEGLPYYEWPFTQVGKLLSAAKYDRNQSASLQIAKILHDIAVRHPGFRSATATTSVPPHEVTARRDDSPDYWTRLLSEWLNRPYIRLTRTRSGAKQRDIVDPAEARNNQAFSMAADDGANGQRVLVIDDFYTDGDTMSEAVRALRAAGTATVLGLCAAKTAKGGLHGVV